MIAKGLSIPVTSTALVELLRLAAPERVPEDLLLIGVEWIPSKRLFLFSGFSEQANELPEAAEFEWANPLLAYEVRSGAGQ